jgi:hypothetical protein
MSTVWERAFGGVRFDRSARALDLGDDVAWLCWARLCGLSPGERAARRLTKRAARKPPLSSSYALGHSFRVLTIQISRRAIESRSLGAETFVLPDAGDLVTQDPFLAPSPAHDEVEAIAVAMPTRLAVCTPRSISRAILSPTCTDDGRRKTRRPRVPLRGEFEHR